MAEGGRNTETGLGKSIWSCTKPVTTRPTVGILPPLSNATKTGTVTGGWAQLEPGLLVLDEDCVTALLPASPFRLLILLLRWRSRMLFWSRGPPEALKLFTPGYRCPQ